MSRIAEKAVTNWVNLPGHFQTMIGADYDTLGVGIIIDNGRFFGGEPQCLQSLHIILENIGGTESRLRSQSLFLVKYLCLKPVLP